MKTETMELTCLECLKSGEIILRPATKIINHTDGSLGKKLLKKDLKGQVKIKHTSPEKCLKIHAKDNPDKL